jgi:hypothetical protein
VSTRLETECCSGTEMLGTVLVRMVLELPNGPQAMRDHICVPSLQSENPQVFYPQMRQPIVW